MENIIRLNATEIMDILAANLTHTAPEGAKSWQICMAFGADGNIFADIQWFPETAEERKNKKVN